LVKFGGYLYGTTVGGGGNQSGTAFKISTSGTNFTTLHSFGGSEGRNPAFGLIYSGGVFYGTTNDDSTFGHGAVFKMDPSGSVTTLLAFANGAASGDLASRLVKIGNYLYGTTYNGGATSPGLGAIYRVKTNGANYQVLHSFTGGTTDGEHPFIAQLVSFAGYLYGITPYGGQWGKGTVFRIDPDGNNYSVVYSFQGAPTDAGYPIGPLLAVEGTPASPAVLYGTTATGGASNIGTVFKIDVNGVETTLYSFTNGADGGVPQSELINIPDGGQPHLYGTNASGGQGGKGVAFEFTP
jgi:uncharacterized repeat protein (TIGR03803 family)